MRAGIYGMWVTLGLVASSLAQAGDMQKATSMPPEVELVVDTSMHPFDSLYAVPRPSAAWARSVRTTFDQPGFTGLEVALSSPGILFGLPHDFHTSRCISPRDLPPGWFPRAFANETPCTP